MKLQGSLSQSWRRKSRAVVEGFLWAGRTSESFMRKRFLGCRNPGADHGRPVALGMEDGFIRFRMRSLECFRPPSCSANPGPWALGGHGGLYRYRPRCDVSFIRARAVSLTATYPGHGGPKKDRSGLTPSEVGSRSEAKLGEEFSNPKNPTTSHGNVTQRVFLGRLNSAGYRAPVSSPARPLNLALDLATAVAEVCGRSSGVSGLQSGVSDRPRRHKGCFIFFFADMFVFNLHLG